MNITEFVENLNQKGVRLWTDSGKLKIHSPKGVIDSQLKQELADRKQEILQFLNNGKGEQTCAPNSNNKQLSLQTIGRLIGGFCDPNRQGYKPPVVESQAMAQQLAVTFRPLPKGYNNQTIIKFRETLQQKLTTYGVHIEPWEQATREFDYDLKIPLINLTKTIKTRAVKAGISAVVDVDRPPSWLGKAKIWLAERMYRFYSRFILKNRRISVLKITQFISWAEENIRQLEDPNNTQAIVLTDLDKNFTDVNIPYQNRIPIGVSTLIKTFSEIVIGVSSDRLSILNMNLSDSTFPIAETDKFILKSLIPKIYVPILPLPMSRFEVGKYEPDKSDYATKLVNLGQNLAPTNLLPAGFKIDNVVKRKSHRDIVDWMANGRTGVSYGFVAYAEPPQYVGEKEISEAEWSSLSEIPGFSPTELRQNQAGRRYLKTWIDNRFAYKQLPDIWLVSSRSGSNKTNLNLATDVLRIGLTDKLLLQMPQGIDVAAGDIKPSYDIYVMVAIALATALYIPELIAEGMPMVHFHGYPARDWFAENEYFTGIENPSVPCGTYESGVFNFLGIHKLANLHNQIDLMGLVEPDHGINIIARDWEHLVIRLNSGIKNGQIELGGKHFASLKEVKEVKEVAVAGV